MKKIILSIAIILVLVFLVDFINFKTTLNTVKKNLPVGGAGYIFVKGFGYVPFLWNGKIKGQIIIKSTYDDFEKPTKVRFWLTLDGDNVISDGYTTDEISASRKRKEGDYRFTEFYAYVVPINFGQKVYKQVYKGDKEIDYQITPEIVLQYKVSLNQIDSERQLNDKDIKFLCSFTKWELHQYVIDTATADIRSLFTYPNKFAYELDQLLPVKYEKLYETEFTKTTKNARILLYYVIDGQSYFKWFNAGTWIGCLGGGYSFSDWRK